MSTLGHPTGKGCTNASTVRGGLPSPVLPPDEPIDGPTERPLLSRMVAGDPAVQLSLPFHPTRQLAIRRCYCPTSSSLARQSAIRRCRTPPNPLPPCPGPIHVDEGVPARATRLTTRSPALKTGPIAYGTPKSRQRLPRPSSESVGLRSCSAGVRSRALVLLGSLHVELSSWRRGNPPPPPATRATTVTGGSGGGLVHFTPHPSKTKHMGATHPCSSARRHLYSNRSMGGPGRYSKGSVGDHRSQGSNQLLRGARQVRYLQGGCLLRYNGTRVTGQTHPTLPQCFVSACRGNAPLNPLNQSTGAPL